MKIKLFIPLTALILIAIGATDAFAVQTHADPEGYYVHQMAHVIFAAAMIYMMYALKSPAVSSISGWRFLRYASFVFLLWNIDTFIGHEMEEELGRRSNYIKDGALFLMSPTAVVYYVARIAENIMLVVAFVLLAIGLRKLGRYLESELPS